MHPHRSTCSTLSLFFALALAGTGSVAAQLGPTGTQFWNQSSPGIGIAMEEEAYTGTAVTAGDFDCDGYDDLAVGMPGEDLVGGVDAGRLFVLYSGPAGLSSDGRQIWGQNSPVVEDEAEPGDYFSSVLVAGDFDGNGCADLAIGSPREDIGDNLDAGAVNVLYGSPLGLTGDDDDFWNQDVAGIAGSAEPMDHFGASLAVGDFDGDGIDDLAIGVPGEDVGSVQDAGMVQVLFGSGTGLVTAGAVALRRGNGLSGSPQADEALGSALAAGDFGILPGDELAVGAPGRDVAGVSQAGAVVLVSDVDGSAFDSEWSQGTNGVPGAPEAVDHFGAALAGGDFDGDGVAELAVGVPWEDVGTIVDAGAVNILEFDGDPMTLWTQDDLNPEHSEAGDQFGTRLLAADFDADGADDLVIGVPYEDLGQIPATGLIHVLYGEPGTGLSNSRDQIWIQTIDPSEDYDWFGFALAAGRFEGHSGADLAIGVPHETIGAFSETGAVNILYSLTLFRDGFESGDVSRWSAATP